MVSTKNVLLNIGPLDRFDDGQPNYMDRLRKSFKAGNPLIPSLLPYCEGKNVRKPIAFPYGKAVRTASAIRNCIHIFCWNGCWKNWV